MSAELEAKTIKLLRYLYQKIYDAVESEVVNDRIKQLEEEKKILLSQNIEYLKLKAELDLVSGYWQETNIKLIEAMRLLDIQKVAEGQAKVEEIERTHTLYEEVANEVVNLKISVAYATQRNNEIISDNQKLRKELQTKENKISEMEQTILLLTSENSRRDR